MVYIFQTNYMQIFTLHLLITYDCQKIQENVEENRSRLCYMDEVGDYLLQKSEAIDAVRVQRDLDEFHGFSSQVLKRVTKLSNRLNKASQSKVRNTIQ